MDPALRIITGKLMSRQVKNVLYKGKSIPAHVQVHCKLMSGQVKNVQYSHMFQYRSNIYTLTGKLISVKYIYYQKANVIGISI